MERKKIWLIGEKEAIHTITRMHSYMLAFLNDLKQECRKRLVIFKCKLTFRICFRLINFFFFFLIHSTVMYAKPITSSQT